jgi:glucose-1-phosphate thymidylyltransferase
VSKQLLPVYDKPMIYYPLSVLMLAGIQDVLIISTSQDLPNFQKLLGYGAKFGLDISYAEQPNPNGLAEAFIIGEKYLEGNHCCLILGDNIFYGQGFTPVLQQVGREQKGATVFGYRVANPEEFGVVEFDDHMKVVSIEEKPSKPKSNYAVPGLYFYDNDVIEIAKKIKPSTRGELEISSINQIYLQESRLRVELLGRGFAWLDTGTYNNLLAAGQFVETIEKRQGHKIACLEEIAFRNSWISENDLINQANKYTSNSYGLYLQSLLEEKQRELL